MAKSLRLRVIYEPLSPGDGRRFLVRPLWPRGLKKEACKLDGWLKERGPWDKLRRWFGHDPARCEEFQRRYFEELDQQPGTCQAIAEQARKRTVIPLYAPRDPEHNNAVALKTYLERIGKSKGNR